MARCRARSLVVVTALYVGLPACAFLGPAPPRRFLNLMNNEPMQASDGNEPPRPEWLVARNPAAVQGSSPIHSDAVRRECSSSMREGGFNAEHITDVLVQEHRGNLVRLAHKFGNLVESTEDVETISITDLDGDHMQLDVVYCDRGEQTCVAVAVPIAFPYHCDDGACVIDAIHDLEEMEGVVQPSVGELKLPQKSISPELMETIARICVVMNRDFQDELVGFVRAYGGKIADEPLGACEMVSLTPDGFMVQAALQPHNPVSIAFSRECLSGRDFQKQILEISQQAMMFA